MITRSKHQGSIVGDMPVKKARNSKYQGGIVNDTASKKTRNSRNMRKDDDTIGCVSTSEIPEAPFTPKIKKETGNILSRQCAIQSEELLSKKHDVMPKECYFMAVAKLAARRSKDPSMQVGACLVDADEKFILGVGYNGTPNNIPDDEYPWYKMDPQYKEKCKNAYVIHAEANALSLSDRTRHKGSIMYCTHYPCSECAKAMVHAGVKKIIFYDDQKLRSEDKAYTYVTSEILLQYCEGESIMTHQKFTNMTEKTVEVTVNVEKEKAVEVTVDVKNCSSRKLFTGDDE